MVNLAYFVYFLRALLSVRVLKNVFLTIKATVLEVFFMILATIMLVFVLAEDTGFQDSWIHKALSMGRSWRFLGLLEWSS